MFSARATLILPPGGSASDADAEQNRRVLDILIRERLAKDRDMEQRLQLCEERLRLTSAAYTFDNDSVRSGATADSDNLTIVPETTNNGHTSGSTQHADTSLNHDIPYREFEELLSKSWVYRRNVNREENMSFRSSVLRVSAWSALSDMSLANLSIIAVMALPVQIQELAHGHWYETQPENEFTEPDGAGLVADIPDLRFVHEALSHQHSDAHAESTGKEPDSTLWTPFDDEDVVYSCRGCGEVHSRYSESSNADILTVSTRFCQRERRSSWPATDGILSASAVALATPC